MEREINLAIDGGIVAGDIPVRCVGYENDDHSFTIESVFVDIGGKSYDLIDNLKESVVEWLEAKAADQLMWESA